MRRQTLHPTRLLIATLLAVTCNVTAFGGVGALPTEPVAIGTTPQFFVDDYIVDNRFAIKYKNYALVRKFHQPVKHAANPLIDADGGYVNVAYDEAAKLFRMWYQVHYWDDPVARGRTNYAIAYAESKDGIKWVRPKLGLFKWKGTTENNICLKGPKQARASGPQILLSIPEREKRGYRFIMTYRTGGSGKDSDGIRLVGSNDGIHWDAKSETRIKHIHSDTLNSIVYDPARKQFVMFCRAKHIYRTFKGNIIDTGASRRIANPTLWDDWPADPQNILIPDSQDSAGRFNFFYGMPTHFHADIYWGFPWAFRMNDPIHTQLATSRDSVHWERLPARPAVIPLGKEGTWDDGMTFGGPHWIEVGDQWWFYYAGYDGGHQSKERTSRIGLATVRKEGLISLHGPKNGGGVVITRQITWPGGDLLLNVAAPEGEVKVRLSDAKRKVIPGYDYEDCNSFTGDSTSQRMTWKKADINDLKGKTIRLEIFIQNADLYTFRAAEKTNATSEEETKP
jgi:hypothetical protein